MPDVNYLRLGLDQLCGSAGTEYFKKGHRNTAIIAACYLCSENEVSDRARNVIRSRLDQHYLDDKNYAAMPDEAADTSLLMQIPAAIMPGACDLREVGHNIIFGANALKVFARLPELITRTRIRGICELVQSFNTTQNIHCEAGDSIPSLDQENRFIEFIFETFLQSLKLYQGYGQGYAGHLLTFGHAILELYDMGYEQLAQTACNAYTMYVKTLKRGPAVGDREIPEHGNSGFFPLQYEYWERRKSVATKLGHEFKYPYSFYGLYSRVENDNLKNKCLQEAFRIF